MRYLYLMALLWLGCSDRPPTTPETRPVENPNAGNTAIYDVDPDDPYEIGDGSFLDMRPGLPLAAFDELLGAGEREEAAAATQVYYIRGRRGEELGYVVPDGTRIGRVVITSPDVVTENGIRVGNSYAELTERRGRLRVGEVREEEPAYLYLIDGDLQYRLNLANNQYEVDTATMDPTAVITHIEIAR